MYHICVNDKSMFRANTIQVGLNLWNFAKLGYKGRITLKDDAGNILYFKQQL